MPNNSLDDILIPLRNADLIRRKVLGIALDQSHLKEFIPRNYAIHKEMKNIIVSNLLADGVDQKEIFIENRPFKDYRFRCDVVALHNGSLTLFECHNQDSWGSDTRTHLYNHIDEIKHRARVVICVTDSLDAKRQVEKRKNRLLKAAHEIWILDIKNKLVKRAIAN